MHPMQTAIQSKPCLLSPRLIEIAHSHHKDCSKRAHKQVHSPSHSWQAIALYLCSKASLPFESKGCSFPEKLKCCLRSINETLAWARTAVLVHAPQVSDPTPAPFQHSCLQGTWVWNMKTNLCSCFLHVPTAAAGSGFSALCGSKSTSKGGQKQLYALLFI